jgi:hypothetical protein
MMHGSSFRAARASEKMPREGFAAAPEADAGARRPGRGPAEIFRRPKTCCILRRGALIFARWCRQRFSALTGHTVTLAALGQLALPDRFEISAVTARP